MNNLLSRQYDLVKASRAVVLQYLATEVLDNMFKPVRAFNHKTIAAMMVHVANTYLSWAGNFALAFKRPYYDDQTIHSIDRLHAVFNDIDTLMTAFIVAFQNDPFREVKGYKWEGRYIETDGYAIYTHVLTHEFHHKGQVMTMSRLLGHTPPDTDILRF